MAHERGRGFSTRAIHEAKAPPIDQETPSVPIYQTSTFRFADSDEYAETISFRKAGYTYTRGYGNTTLGAFEELMANLEGTESAFSFSSGMAAMHAVFTTLAATGDRIVSSNELYGGAYSLFTKVMPRYGVAVDLVDPTTWTRSPPRPGRRSSTSRRSRTRTSPSRTSRRWAHCRANGVPPSSTTRSHRRSWPTRRAGVRVRLALGDEVHRRAQRPYRGGRVRLA
jgi:hypothetical protein